MEIWQYPEPSRDVSIAWVQKERCVFCGTAMKNVRKHVDSSQGGGRLLIGGRSSFATDVVRHCLACGWWSVSKVQESHRFIGCRVEDGISRIHQGACGSLKELDLTDVQAALDEVRDYLTARYDARFRVEPSVFEQVVASVFAGLGYDVVVTGYHAGSAPGGDDGVDVVLSESNGNQIGVQVKRYKNSIEVEQIRAFAGALLIAGLHKGVFVTTSRFQSGAEATVQRYLLRGYKVELMDAVRFYDALKIAQTKTRAQPSEATIQRWLSHSVILENSFQGFNTWL